MGKKIRTGLAQLDAFAKQHIVPYGIIVYTLSMFDLIIPVVLFMATKNVLIRGIAIVLLVLLVSAGLYIRYITLLNLKDKIQKYVSIINTAVLQLTCIVVTAGSVLLAYGSPIGETISQVGRLLALASVLIGIVLVFWNELFYEDDNDDKPSGPVGMA